MCRQPFCWLAGARAESGAMVGHQGECQCSWKCLWIGLSQVVQRAAPLVGRREGRFRHDGASSGWCIISATDNAIENVDALD